MCKSIIRVGDSPHPSVTEKTTRQSHKDTGDLDITVNRLNLIPTLHTKYKYICKHLLTPAIGWAIGEVSVSFKRVMS